MNRVVQGLIAVNFILVALLAAPSTQAHPSSNFYSPATGGGNWPTNANELYYFYTNVPSNWKSVINKGLNRWSNRANGNGPNFNPGGTVTAHDLNSCTGSSTISRQNNVTMNGGLGRTDTCFNFSGDIVAFDIYFNQNVDAADPPSNSWYVGTGSPGNSEWDLFSIATHEAGHATGWGGHFAPNAGLCDNNNSAQTMCIGNYNYRRGTGYLRTLENHDVHTIGNAY